MNLPEWVHLLGLDSNQIRHRTTGQPTEKGTMDAMTFIRDILCQVRPRPGGFHSRAAKPELEPAGGNGHRFVWG